MIQRFIQDSDKQVFFLFNLIFFNADFYRCFKKMKKGENLFASLR